MHAPSAAARRGPVLELQSAKSDNSVLRRFGFAIPGLSLTTGVVPVLVVFFSYLARCRPPKEIRFPIFRKYFQNLGRRGHRRARVLLTKSLLNYDLRS